MSAQLSLVTRHLTKNWSRINPVVHLPKNKQEYDMLVGLLDELLDMVAGSEKHELISLIDTISHFIEEYEHKYEKSNQKRATGIDALKFLMEAHGLNQSDLKEIGSQGVVSEILNGKRLLNVRQIKLLSERFGVDPSTFID